MAVLPSPETKILTFDKASEWRKELRASRGRLVVTNGCFDVIHRGHVEYLFKARSFGDALLVGLNSDNSVRGLKGAGRPLNDEFARALTLGAFYFVDAVVVFDSIRCTGLLEAVCPDVYVKGGDYNLETMDPGERKALTEMGAEIKFVDFVPGFSTSSVLERMSES